MQDRLFSLKELLEIKRRKSSDSFKSSGDQHDPSTMNELSILEFNIPGTSTLMKLRKLQAERISFGVRSVNYVNDKQFTICVLLVIVDKLIHESIWKAWMQAENFSSKYKVKLIIHAKYPDKIKSSWVKERTIPETFSPEWNSPEVIRAMLAILEHGLKDPSCGRFVFGTESCLPIYDLERIGDILFEKVFLTSEV